MSRAAAFLTLAAAMLGLLGCVVVAKAQSNPSIWYAWILTSPLIVPALLVLTFLFLLLAGREWGPFQKIIWSNLPRVIPRPTEPPAVASANVPELCLQYRKQGTDDEILTFDLRQGGPVRIGKVGPLVSEEAYRTEQEVILLQGVIPDVEDGRPVDCRISAVRNAATRDSTSLAEALEAGGPTTLDHVSVEYADAKHNEFTSRFVLHKNQDGSIVLRSEPESPSPPGDLAELRKRLRLLESCVPVLTFSGELKVLADEARCLVELLEQQRAEAQAVPDQGALAVFEHPLSMKIFRETPESAAWTWGMKSLWKFQALYAEHRQRALSCSLPIRSEVLSHGIPDDQADWNEVVKWITQHEEALTKHAKAQRLRYVPGDVTSNT